MANYGVINEIGDMGLEFYPLNEKDNAAVNEAYNKERKDQTTVINEDQKNK